MIVRHQHVAIASVVLALGGLAAAKEVGLRINATPSMPIGIWQVVNASNALRAGSIVVACPPDNGTIREAAARGYIAKGTCAGAWEPLLKPVAAVGGDIIAVSDAGVMINGRLLAGTIPLTRDSAGRSLSRFATTHYRLQPDELWLTSNVDPRSFDSRYFGPVPASHVIGVARAVLTFR